MAKENKNWIMVQFIREILILERKMVKEDIIGVTVNMREMLRWDNQMVLEDW